MRVETMESSATRQDETGGARPGADALLEAVRELATELRPNRAAMNASLDGRLEQDYGFDSLGRVELFLRIERRFGVSLPEAVMASAETPRDLLRAMLAAGSALPSHAAAVERAAALASESAVPDKAQTLAEVLEWHLARHAGRLHLVLMDDE